MSAHENLTTNEAAAFLRTSPRTLIRWRNARRGPRWVKPGGKILYRRSDLEKWLDDQSVEPVAEGVAHAR